MQCGVCTRQAPLVTRPVVAPESCAVLAAPPALLISAGCPAAGQGWQRARRPGVLVAQSWDPPGCSVPAATLGRTLVTGGHAAHTPPLPEQARRLVRAHPRAAAARHARHALQPHRRQGAPRAPLGCRARALAHQMYLQHWRGVSPFVVRGLVAPWTVSSRTPAGEAQAPWRTAPGPRPLERSRMPLSPA